MTHDQITRILALAAQLCDFVDSIECSDREDRCRLSLAEAHRARVTVNNLRPLLRTAELSTQPIAPVDKP